MKQKTLFRGIATALATPMTSSGAIDYDAYGRLIDWQIESGVAGLVTCGTTGEASTMTAEEHRQTIAFAVKRAAGRVPVIAGTGANCTEKAVELTRFACAAGADACLVVTPYYNKATQRGLIAHYTAIADASDRPVILYNVPSRTGCNLLPETCAALAGHPRIAAVKEASGNLSQIVSLFHRAAASSGRLFRQRRSDRADSRHGRRGLHLRTLQCAAQGGGSAVRAVLLRRCARRCGAPVPSAARHRRAVFRGQSHSGQGGAGKNGLRHRHAASAAHPDGGRTPGRPSERARSMGCLR